MQASLEAVRRLSKRVGMPHAELTDAERVVPPPDENVTVLTSGQAPSREPSIQAGCELVPCESPSLALHEAVCELTVWQRAE